MSPVKDKAMLNKILIISLSALVTSMNGMQNTITDDEALIDATSGFQIEMSGVELLVKKLLEVGASPVTRDNRGWTPLHLSVAAGKREVVKVLLDGGCPVDIRTKDPMKSPALHIAIVNGRKDVINLLLARGASPNSKDRLETCPFHVAIIHRDLATLKLLVARGADLSLPIAVANTSTLELASQAGSNGVSPEIFTYVLQQGATYPEGYEALARKLEKHQPQFAELLRTYKPKAPHCTSCKKSPEKLRACGTCKKVRYCDATCQKIDWARHKEICQPIEAPKEAKAHHCATCKKSSEKLKVCGTCKKVRYCDVACQKKDRATHKEVCEPAEEAKEGVEECCICLNRLGKQVISIGLGCNHGIHSACRKLLVGAKNFNGLCPICRAKVE